MIWEAGMFAIPLALWLLYYFLRSEDGPGRIRLRKYSLIYLFFQVIANAYVWYSFWGGYRDWLMTLALPYSVLFIGGLIGLTIFFDCLRVKATRNQ